MVRIKLTGRHWPALLTLAYPALCSLPVCADTSAIDPAAVKALGAMSSAYAKIKTYYGAMERRNSGSLTSVKATILWKAPNRAFVQASSANEELLAICDGVALHSTSTKRRHVLNQYVPLDRRAVVETLKHGQVFTLGATDQLPIGGDIVAGLGKELTALKCWTKDVSTKLHVLTIEATLDMPNAPTVITYEIDKDTYLLRKVSSTRISNGIIYSVEEVHSDVSIDQPIDDSIFEFIPPPLQ